MPLNLNKYIKFAYILLFIESRQVISKIKNRMIILHGTITFTMCMPKHGVLVKINKTA